MVRCADCGFLCIRDIEDFSFVGADTAYREEGFQTVGQNDPLPMPNCYVREHNIHKEPVVIQGIAVAQEAPTIIKAVGPGGQTGMESAVLNIIQKERDCDAFFQWRGEGISPKEHIEMQERQRWRDWQQQQRQEDKRWRIIELVVLGIMTVLIAGGFTILGAFIERGSVP